MLNTRRHEKRLPHNFKVVVSAGRNQVANIARQDDTTRRRVVSCVVSVDQESVTTLSVVAVWSKCHHGWTMSFSVMYGSDCVPSPWNRPNIALILALGIVSSITRTRIACCNHTAVMR